MLVSNAAFLAQVSPEAAEKLTVEVEKAVNPLETMRQRCPWRSGEYIPKNTYRTLKNPARQEPSFLIQESAAQSLG